MTFYQTIQKLLSNLINKKLNNYEIQISLYSTSGYDVRSHGL
jgi:hypothetical protein